MTNEDRHLLWFCQSTAKLNMVSPEEIEVTMLETNEIPEGFAPLHHGKCGKTAFYIRLNGSRQLLANDVRYLYGSGPNPGDMIQCGACGDDDMLISDIIRFRQNGEFL